MTTHSTDLLRSQLACTLRKYKLASLWWQELVLRMHRSHAQGRRLVQQHQGEQQQRRGDHDHMVTILTSNLSCSSHVFL
jgi:hypothetical protein